MTGDIAPDARTEALIQIGSTDSHQRYLGAKALVDLGTPEDIRILMVARRSETEAYARKWINLAIGACNRKLSIELAQEDRDEAFGLDDDVRIQIRAQAIEWVAGIILHEIGSKIGLLAGAAKREIGETYATSDTSRHVKNLERIFEAVVELRKAAAVPKLVEFDVAQLIKEIADLEGSEVEISLVGRRPLLIMSDPALLQLAICNGIRNAVEAVRAVDDPGSHGVIINWEITDKDFWISIIDDGLGISGPTDILFEISRSNKAGHMGFGLAIAKLAMEVLGGAVQLSSSASGGAAYQINGTLNK